MEGPLSGEALSVPRRGAEGGRPHAGSPATLVFDADMPKGTGCMPGPFPVFFLQSGPPQAKARFFTAPLEALRFPFRMFVLDKRGDWL